jgi:hypothetical protein
MESASKEELVQIVQWLLRHPDELALMRVAVALDYTPDTVWPDVEAANAEALKYEAERYFKSGFFGWCPGCGLPYVIFADGVAIEWQTRERHKCEAPPKYRAVLT